MDPGTDPEMMDPGIDPETDLGLKVLGIGPGMMVPGTDPEMKVLETDPEMKVPGIDPEKIEKVHSEMGRSGSEPGFVGAWHGRVLPFG